MSGIVAVASTGVGEEELRVRVFSFFNSFCFQAAQTNVLSEEMGKKTSHRFTVNGQHL